MSHKSIYLYQKYQIIGDQAPIPVYPEVYSIDADGTMPIVTKMDEDPACGGITPIEPQYRWVVSTGYVCSGTNKMTREIEEISYDSGATWTPTGDERAAYPLIEADSPDCGYVPPTPIYRWTNMDISTDYICDDCPAPVFEGKWLATYTGGTTSSAQCDATSAITRNEVNKTNIISVEIGDCVTSIGDSAFFGYSGLTDITISDSVTSIGQYAFLGCYALSSATIPNSVTSISGSAFSSCYSLTSVTIPDSVTSIGDYVFRHSSGLTSAIIGNGITSIGQETFYSCSGLTSVTIGNSVTSIGPNVFNWCTSLSSITIPNSVISIGDGAFSNCSGLTSVTIGNSVTSIGNQAFSDCRSLTSVTIPNNVTSIGDGAFSYCSGLTSVIIGNSVTSIGNSVFFECSSLTSVTVQAITPPTIGTYVFYNTNNNLVIYVPAASVSAYKSATNWSNYSSRIQAIP